MATPSREVPERARLRRDLLAISADGVAFSVMVGVGETYLVPFALALGIAAGQASLLATLPILAGSLLSAVVGSLVLNVLLPRGACQDS